MLDLEARTVNASSWPLAGWMLPPRSKARDTVAELSVNRTARHSGLTDDGLRSFVHSLSHLQDSSKGVLGQAVRQAAARQQGQAV